MLARALLQGGMKESLPGLTRAWRKRWSLGGTPRSVARFSWGEMECRGGCLSWVLVEAGGSNGWCAAEEPVEMAALLRRFLSTDAGAVQYTSTGEAAAIVAAPELLTAATVLAVSCSSKCR